MPRHAGWVVPIVVVLVVLIVLVMFRDARVPLDGCTYAIAAREFIAGNFTDAFRWSHALHVPVLALGFRYLGGIFTHDFLEFYQMLDIVLGAAGLGFLYLLLRRVVGGGWRPVPACALVLFSWAFWSEAVMADEKMTGFLLVLAYLHVLVRRFERLDSHRSSSEIVSGLASGVLLGLTVLMHASSILVVPATVFLVVQHRAYKFAASAVAAGGVLVVGFYLVILNVLSADNGAAIGRYFSSGVTSYSVFATGLRGLPWLRECIQGLTKLNWAVFSEDGLRAAQVLALLTLAMWAGVMGLVWRVRGERGLHWVFVLLVTGMLFGLTYAPSAPDSYMILLVPLAVYFTVALRFKWGRTLVVLTVVLVVVFNGYHYRGFASNRDAGADARYQQAIAGRLAAGKVLVVLDAETGAAAGTQTILPIHRYHNPQLLYVMSSDFLANPDSAEFQDWARAGVLLVEGICFETWETRSTADITASSVFAAIERNYEIVPVVTFTEYSSAYHRRYKNIYQLRPSANP